MFYLLILNICIFTETFDGSEQKIIEGYREIDGCHANLLT